MKKCHSEKLDKYFVYCKNCRNNVKTKIFSSDEHEDAENKAIDAWNSGHVYVSELVVVLPTLHYMTERKILKKSCFESSEMTIKITKERDIADHLKYMLSIVLKPDGTINPYMFKLYQGFALHTGVQLLDIKDCGSYSMDFIISISRYSSFNNFISEKKNRQCLAKNTHFRTTNKSKDISNARRK